MGLVEEIEAEVDALKASMGEAKTIMRAMVGPNKKLIPAPLYMADRMLETLTEAGIVDRELRVMIQGLQMHAFLTGYALGRNEHELLVVDQKKLLKGD